MILRADARFLPLADTSVAAIVTDPPYELGFMGRTWDLTGVAYDPATWAQAYRVLKPGGHLLAFGGTRTWHRLTCAIEDAGLEIRDTITWLYGSGFPKSLDVSKAIDKAAGAEREVVGVNPRAAQQTPKRGTAALGNFGGTADVLTAPATDDARRWRGWGTALKPASEPIVVARKPLAGTVAANVLAHGTGALNIDACRVQYASDADRAFTEAHNRHGAWQSGPRDNRVYGADIRDRAAGGDYDAARGRWPTNVILSHPGNDTDGDLCANGCIPGCPVAELDRQSGVSADGVAVNRNRAAGKGSWYGTRTVQTGVDLGYGGAGGASRFFPIFRYQAKAPTAERPKVDGMAHPTVKPLALMRWLVRLVTPPDGLVLDPFGGSGTTWEACAVEGFRCITIESDASHLPLINARVSKPIQPVLDLFGDL